MACCSFQNSVTRQFGEKNARRQLRGDLLDVAAEVPPADIVALDRVVCCYPRAAMALANVLLRSTSGFRTFVHSEGATRRLIELAGFELVSHSHDIAWSADVVARRTSNGGAVLTSTSA